ncbi:efflux RND transporter permease subunit, partial [Parabacteroides sp. Marseille-P3160]|uniref:efflux RND transporter permease subunit n=2 Tax=Parabacteroides sp. Marseille-P3160 TaxID=1917887 RepID=UPI0009BA14D5
WTIRPRLLSTGGVAQAAVIGGDIKEYQILLDQGRMKHYGIGLDEVLAVCRNMNRNANGGVLYEFGSEFIIRGILSTSKAEEIGKGMIKTIDGAAVTLSDIATIRIGAKSPKLGLASEKGKPAVLLTVTKQPGTSTVDLTDRLDVTIADLQKNLPPDVRVSTDAFRQSRFIDSSINNIKNCLIEGSFFVLVILLLFLMNVRTTAISLVAMPLSLLVSVLVLKWMGLTINTMSLGGMAIAIGSLVDDAIVDVENVYRKIRENRKLPAEEQRPVLQVVHDASCEVRMPIFNSTLIIVVSFIPLFFLSGMEGRMLMPLGIAFIISLFASTIVALTLTPVLCSYLLSFGRGQTVEKESIVVCYLKQYYARALQVVLNHKKIVLGSTFTLFAIAVGLSFTLGRNFLPPFNEGSFTINVSALPGISLEESDRIGRLAENLLLQVPEIKTVARKTGRAELDEHALGVNESEMEAPFELKGRSREEVMDDVREKLSVISGANVEIGQPISHRLDAMLSGTEANIAIKLFGTDLNRLFTIGNQIKDAISGIDGVVDLKVEQQVERPQLTITPRRELLAKYGIPLPEFEEYIQVMLSGESVGQVYEDGKYFDLTLKVSDDSRGTMEQISNLMIDAGGEKIPLSYVADIRSTTGPNTINRENVQRKIVISSNVSGRDLRGVVDDIQKKVASSVTLPEGYHLEYGGQFESEQSASRTLLLTSAMALLVIFFLLLIQFRNARESGIVLLNLPLALIGGVLILWLTSGELSIPAIIGFISLFGIATRNGMLLISHYQQLRSEGLGLQAAVLQGSLDRLNPILMTALCSALALIPLAVKGDLPGNEIQSPMAVVILGGLLTSTFLNGFIIPIVYLLMNKNQQE